MSPVVVDPELTTECRAALDRMLEPDEGVWAVIRGRDGTTLVGTDRRLFAMPDETGRPKVQAWPYRELDDLRAVERAILVRTRHDKRHLVTLPTAPERTEQTMQAVTIIELLIARSSRRS